MTIQIAREEIRCRYMGSKGSFICTILCYTNPLEHGLEREIAQWVHHEDRIDPTTHRAMNERF